MRKLFLGTILAILLLVSGVSATNFDAIPDQTWDEAYPWVLDLTKFSTVLTGTVTYSIKEPTEGDVIVNLGSDGKATFTFADEDWVGKNIIRFSATNGTTVVDSNVVNLIKDVPAYCDVSDGTKIKIGDIDFDDDKYKIGDTVKVSVEDVEASTEDLEDVGVEVCLYNVDEDQEIECWEAENGVDIDEDDKEDFEIEFTIPNSEDIGKKDNYRLIVYVIADDENGDSQCVQDSEEIEIQRETHDVIVESVSLSPSVVKPGETTQLTVRVENIGTKDEEDCYVVLKDNILGIDLESSKFDLDDYTDTDNTNTVRFMITILGDAKAQDYLLEPVVYFDDGSQTKGGKTATLNVEKVEVVPKKPSLVVTSGITTIDTTKGKDVNLHLIITNNEENDLDATVGLNVIGNWAENILEQPVSLHPGENNVYLPLTLKEVTEGKYTATVTIKQAGTSKFDTKQSTLSFDVTGELKKEVPPITGAVTGIKGSSVFWIIGDVVLVIIALFFIKAIFFGRRKQE